MMCHWLSILLITLTALVIVVAFITGNDDSNAGFTFAVGGLAIAGLVGWCAVGVTYHADYASRNVIAQNTDTGKSLVLTDTETGRVLTSIFDIATYNKYKSRPTLTIEEQGFINIYYNTNWSGVYKIIDK